MNYDSMTKEEIIAKIRERNNRAHATNRAKGNECRKVVVLNKEDNNKMEDLLAKLDCTFPQMIRRLISGEYEIHLRDENKQ
jgi:hypothetical protein